MCVIKTEPWKAFNSEEEKINQTRCVVFFMDCDCPIRRLCGAMSQTSYWQATLRVAAAAFSTAVNVSDNIL